MTAATAWRRRWAWVSRAETDLASIRQVDFTSRIALPEIIAACDVDNPLLGPRGATAVFSAQKGASPEDQIALEAALTHLVAVSGGEAAADDSRVPVRRADWASACCISREPG